MNMKWLPFILLALFLSRPHLVCAQDQSQENPYSLSTLVAAALLRGTEGPFFNDPNSLELFKGDVSAVDSASTSANGQAFHSPFDGSGNQVSLSQTNGPLTNVQAQNYPLLPPFSTVTSTVNGVNTKNVLAGRIGSFSSSTNAVSSPFWPTQTSNEARSTTTQILQQTPIAVPLFTSHDQIKASQDALVSFDQHLAHISSQNIVPDSVSESSMPQYAAASSITATGQQGSLIDQNLNVISPDGATSMTPLQSNVFNPVNSNSLQQSVPFASPITPGVLEPAIVTSNGQPVSSMQSLTNNLQWPQTVNVLATGNGNIVQSGINSPSYVVDNSPNSAYAPTQNIATIPTGSQRSLPVIQNEKYFSRNIGVTVPGFSNIPVSASSIQTNQFKFPVDYNSENFGTLYQYQTTRIAGDPTHQTVINLRNFPIDQSSQFFPNTNNFVSPETGSQVAFPSSSGVSANIGWAVAPNLDQTEVTYHTGQGQYSASGQYLGDPSVRHYFINDLGTGQALPISHSSGMFSDSQTSLASNSFPVFQTPGTNSAISTPRILMSNLPPPSVSTHAMAHSVQHYLPYVRSSPLLFTTGYASGPLDITRQMLETTHGYGSNLGLGIGIALVVSLFALLLG